MPPQTAFPPDVRAPDVRAPSGLPRFVARRYLAAVARRAFAWLFSVQS